MRQQCKHEAEVLTRDGESRRHFLRGGTALAAAPLAAAAFSGRADAQESAGDALARSQVQAWAVFDTSGRFGPHTVVRREAGPRDVVIEIMYSSICHSDIHT